MSEYQWVEFRAVDAPLDDAALEFMHQQSSRAEIDRWRFVNEYHFGDFLGDVLEMMYRGYDVHVHYSNFGLRRVCFRIPDGFAYVDSLQHYLLEDEIEWIPDDRGTGGVLSLQPEGDAATWDWMEDIESLASDLAPLREMIISGDFRPLYISYVSLVYDDDELEPPIPAGLQNEQYSLSRLSHFYEFDPDLISVAAEASPQLGPANSDRAIIRDWIGGLSKADLATNLASCLTDPNRFPLQLLRKLRTEFTTPENLESGQRTIGELRRRAQEIQDARKRKQQAAAAEEAARRKAEAEKKLQEKLAKIARNPEETIRQIDTAIEERTRAAYQRAAEDLSMLAKACGGATAAAKAEAIRAKYPSRTALDQELRKAGF